MNFPLGHPHSNVLLDGDYYHTKLSWAEQTRLRAWLDENGYTLNDVANIWHEWDSGVATLDVYHIGEDGKKHLQMDCHLDGRRRTTKDRYEVCRSIKQIRDKQ